MSDTSPDEEERHTPVRTALEKLVANGTITQAQMDAIHQAIRAEREAAGDRGGRRRRRGN
jgi:hypothetical protein